VSALEAEVARQREQLAAQQAALDAAPSGGEAQPNPDDAVAAYITDPDDSTASAGDESLLRIYGLRRRRISAWADKTITEITPETTS